MKLTLDHLTIVAPSLHEGVDHVRSCLAIDVPYGGAHREMGTHNHLLRLGDDVFLEIIAVDQGANPPAWPRWFGLSDADQVRADWDGGLRLRGWVAATDDIDTVLASHGHLLGRRMRISRGARSWLFSVPADGSWPVGGIAPSVIDWGVAGSPARGMADLGARLRTFVIEHPEPARVAGLHAELGVLNPPQARMAARLRYRAEIETSAGIFELT